MPKQPHYNYHIDDYRSYQRKRKGFWYRLKCFISDVVLIILSLLSGALLIGLIVLAIAYHNYLRTILLVVLGIGAVIVALLLLKFVIGVVTTIIDTISAMRVRAIQAGKAKVELSRHKLERDAYQQRLQQSQRPKQVVPVPPSAPAPPVSDSQEPLVRRILPAQEPQKSGVPGMPQRTTVSYREIERHVKPGQLAALVRSNGSLRLESWDAFKILLVLGGSSSGKTTTIAEKVLGFVNGGGLIIPCDPHDTKEDSLFKKISPLAPALYPGAVFAVEHTDILRNMRLINAILEDRVQGGDCTIPVLLIVEELNRLLRDKALTKEISLILEALGEEGRGYNVFVLVGCQRVTGLSDIRKAFISAIVHRCDESEARLVIPYRYAKYCSELRPGQCFVKDSDGVTEAGLQALVTRQDIERASMSLSRPLSQGSTTRLDLHQTPQTQRHQSIVSRRPSNRHTSALPAHRTRLERVQHEKGPSEQSFPNPLHTWQLEAPGNEKKPSFSRLSDFANKLPDSFSAPVRNTEELSPNHLSNSQQLEILTLLRKKKSQK